jgi:transcriptional regulator with XRE-family HTH domain
MDTGTVTQLRWRPAIGFSTRLRLVRLDYADRVGHRVNQDEMAGLLGVKPGTYRGWESGNSRPADLIALAQHIYEVTGADPAWLLGVADDNPGPGGSEGQDDSPTRWYGGTVVDLRARRLDPRTLAA